MKKPFIALVIVIAVVVVVVLFLLSNLNSLVAKAIERGGSDVTQTRVRVSGVDISLRDGRGSIKGLEVANPEGFAAREALSLENITVDLDIESLREEPIVIEEIRIQAPAINAEITKTGSSNIDELRRRIQAYSAGSAGERGDAGGRTVRIRVERFLFEEGRIEVDASALGIEKRTIELPEMQLVDVGGASGAPPAEIAKMVLAALAGRVTSEIAGSEIDRLVKEKLGGSAVDKVKDLLKKIGN